MESMLPRHNTSTMYIKACSDIGVKSHWRGALTFKNFSLRVKLTYPGKRGRFLILLCNQDI